MKRIASVILIAAAAACGGRQQRADDLMESVRSYNEGVWWERITMAASWVPPKERDTFIEEREDLIHELHITDYELVRVGAAQTSGAKVEVKYTWYKESEGTVHETRALQSWERHGKTWVIVDERRTRGPEMPGLREPAPAAGSGSGSGSGSDGTAGDDGDATGGPAPAAAAAEPGARAPGDDPRAP